MTRHFLFAIFVAISCGLPSIVHAQADNVRNELIAVGALKPPGIIACTVEGKEIDVAKVNVLMKKSLRGRPVSKAALPTLEAQAVDQIINRELVRKFLDDKKVTVTEAEIDKEIEARQKAALKQSGNLADVRGVTELTKDEFRADVAAEMRWAKYVKSLLTDDVLEKYFEAHRNEFDGTELRVSHILLRPDGPLTPEETDALSARADTIRDEVIGELSTFAEAAKKYSSGPSRQNGGDIGFIPRHGLMPEDFTQAVFALKKGEISKPVVTSLGMHLIQCTDVRPGKKTWRDVRRELLPAATQQIFNSIASKMRQTAKVEYSDEVSHFRPDTGTLISISGPTQTAAKDEEAK